MLSCGFYTIIKNIVCIDYLDSQLKQLIEITVSSKKGSKHEDKRFNIILGIGIPDFWMKLISCRGILKNINCVVILKVF